MASTIHIADYKGGSISKLFGAQLSNAQQKENPFIGYQATHNEEDWMQFLQSSGAFFGPDWTMVTYDQVNDLDQWIWYSGTMYFVPDAVGGMEYVSDTEGMWVLNQDQKWAYLLSSDAEDLHAFAGF